MYEDGVGRMQMNGEEGAGVSERVVEACVAMGATMEEVNKEGVADTVSHGEGLPHGIHGGPWGLVTCD